MGKTNAKFSNPKTNKTAPQSSLKEDNLSVSKKPRTRLKFTNTPSTDFTVVKLTNSDDNPISKELTNSDIPLDQLLNCATYMFSSTSDGTFQIPKTKTSKRDLPQLLKDPTLTRDWLYFTEQEFKVLQSEFMSAKQKYHKSAKKILYPQVILPKTIINLNQQVLFVVDIYNQASIKFILAQDITNQKDFVAPAQNLSPKEKADYINSLTFMEVMHTFIPPIYNPDNKKKNQKEFQQDNFLVFARIGDYLCLINNPQPIKLLLNHFYAKDQASQKDPTYEKGHFINFFPREK